MVLAQAHALSNPALTLPDPNTSKEGAGSAAAETHRGSACLKGSSWAESPGAALRPGT